MALLLTVAKKVTYLFRKSEIQKVFPLSKHITISRAWKVNFCIISRMKTSGSCISLELSRGKTLLTKDFLLISDIRWIGKSRMCQHGSGNEVGFCTRKT